MIEIQFRDEGTYLVAVCQGEWQPAALTKAVTDMRERATQSSHTRIFIDWRNVQGPIIFSYRFVTGEEVAWIRPFPFRVAALDHVEVINKLVEITAVNRGALFLVSHDEQELLQWLLVGLPQSGAQ